MPVHELWQKKDKSTNNFSLLMAYEQNIMVLLLDIKQNKTKKLGFGG